MPLTEKGKQLLAAGLLTVKKYEPSTTAKRGRTKKDKGDKQPGEETRNTGGLPTISDDQTGV